MSKSVALTKLANTRVALSNVMKMNTLHVKRLSKIVFTEFALVRQQSASATNMKRASNPYLLVFQFGFADKFNQTKLITCA